MIKRIGWHDWRCDGHWWLTLFLSYNYDVLYVYLLAFSFCRL